MQLPEYGVRIDFIDTTFSQTNLATLHQLNLTNRVNSISRSLIELRVSGIKLPSSTLQDTANPIVNNVANARARLFSQLGNEDFETFLETPIPFISIDAEPNPDAVIRHLDSLRHVTRKQLMIPVPKPRGSKTKHGILNMFSSWEEALKYSTQYDEALPIGMTLNFHDRKSMGYTQLYKEAVCWKGISIINFSTLGEGCDYTTLKEADFIEIIESIENLYDPSNEFGVTYGSEFSDNNGFGVPNNINFVLAALNVARSRKKVIPLQIHTSIFGMGDQDTRTDFITLTRELDELVEQRYLSEHLKYSYNSNGMVWLLHSILSEMGREISIEDLETVV